MDVSLNKLVGRLDVLSKSMQIFSSKLLQTTTFGFDELNINKKNEENSTKVSSDSAIQNDLPDKTFNITLEVNSEYNATFEKIENLAKEFVANVERLIDNMSFDVLIDKLIRVVAGISALELVIWVSLKKAVDSILASFKDMVTSVIKQINVDCSDEKSKSSQSDWLSKITDTITEELLSGKLFKKFKNIEIVLAGGLTEGNEFLSKLIDAFALAKGGAGTLTESLSAVFGKSGGVANIVAGALIAVTNFVNMLKNGLNWINEIMMLIGTALAALGAVILGVSAGTAALVAGIVAGVATIVIVVKDNWDAICEWFTEMWTKVVNVWEIASEWFNENVIMPIIMFFEGLWENVSSLFTTLWESIAEIWGIVSAWFDENVITPIVTFFEGFFIRVGQIFEGLWIIVQAVWILASTWFNENVVIPVVNGFHGLWESVSGFFIALWEGIRVIWSVVSTWFNENVIIPVTSSFEGVWNNIYGFFENLWDDIKGIWKGVATWFDTTVIQPLIGFFDSLWNGIKQGMVSAMNGVIQGIEDGINYIIDGINNIIAGFNRIVSWAAKVAEVDWGGVDTISRVQLDRIQMYETGGYPESASLFWANEYGVPELIGTVGNKAAVASGTEITGIADAVYSTGQAETSLLTTAVNLLQEIANKNMSVNIGDREIARANYRGQKSLGSRLITEF